MLEARPPGALEAAGGGTLAGQSPARQSSAPGTDLPLRDRGSSLGASAQRKSSPRSPGGAGPGPCRRDRLPPGARQSRHWDWSGVARADEDSGQAQSQPRCTFESLLRGRQLEVDSGRPSLKGRGAGLATARSYPAGAAKPRRRARWSPAGQSGVSGRFSRASGLSEPWGPAGPPGTGVR